MRSYGYLPSPSDLEYNKFGEVRDGITKLGAKIASDTDSHFIEEKIPMFDQLSLNSCAAQSTCAALEILLGIEGLPVVPLSRLFVYWNARMYNQETNKDVGTYISSAFDSLKTLGVCTEDEWDYNTSMVFTQPPLKAFKTANDNTISDYYRIDSYGDDRLNDIETAIRANHPVVFGTKVGQSLEDYQGADKVFDPPTTPIGAHAMCIVGVRRNPTLEFYVRNSWGGNWGLNNGHFWMSSKYAMWDYTSDLWVPTRVDNLLI